MMNPSPTPNRNGRVYPKDVWDKAIKEYLKNLNIKHRREKLKKINNNIK